MMMITSTQSQMQPLLECGFSSSKDSKVNSIADPISTYNDGDDGVNDDDDGVNDDIWRSKFDR